MAAIFTLRKGTSNYSTIADAELYLHQGSGSIQFGSGSGNPVTLLPLNVPANGNIRLTGDITASNAYFTNNVRIDGNIILGDSAAGDTIQSIGVFTTNLIPQGSRNVGSTDAYWSNVYATSISGAIAATNGVISGSAQIPSLLPSGIVSGSSQIVLRSTDGFSAYDSAISTITGSLIASASTAKTANDLQDVNIINLNLTTASLNTSVSNLNLTTASLNTSVSNLNTATANINLTTASLNTSVSNLNTTTASLNTSVLNLELFSSSQLNKDSDLATYTGSVNTRLTEIGVVSGSLIVSASSFETRSATLATYTASVNTRLTEIGVVSGSLIASASAVSTSVWYLNQTSQSLEIRNTTLASVTSSYDTRWSTLASYTGSNDTTNTNQNSRLTALEVSSASVHNYTASLKTALDVSGQNLTVYGNLTVQGTQTTLNTNEVIVEDKTLTLASGSTTSAEADGAGVQIAGANVTMSWDNSNTRVLFNTNLGIIGSISSSTLVGLNGASVASYSSSVTNRLTNLESKSGSVDIRLTEIGVVSGSLINSASSFETRNLTLATYTGSVNTRLTEIGVVSGSLITSASSFETRNATLANVTSSINNRLTEIGVVSGSLIASASAVSTSVWHLHQFSSSQLNKDSDLQTYTSSVNNKFNDLQTYTSSVNTRLTEIGVVSGSLINSASSFETRFGAIATISGSLISTASNHNNRVVALESTASYLQGTFSTSVDSRLDNLEAASSSFSSSILNLNGFSSSQLTQNSNLATHTGSVNTRLTEIGVVTGSLIISASNAKTTNDAQDISISKLNDATASLFISSSTLTASFTALRSEFNTLTASVDPGNVSSQFSNISTRFTTLATLTGSYDTRFTEIGVVSGSLITSASAAKTTNDAQDGRLNNLESKSGSVDTRLTEIGVVSGSLISSASAASIANANQNLFTQSAETRFTEIGVVSGSLISSASAANVSITNINLTTASLNTSVTNLNTATSSYETKGRGIVSGSSQITYASISSIPAGIVSGSSQLSGTTITDLTIINLTTVNQTASVVFSSGSNKFGDELIDVQQFTGSVQVTGSLTTIGNVTATSFNGVINATNGVVSGSSQITLQSTTGFTAYDTALSTITGSLISSASAAKTTNDSQGVSITNLNTTSASVNTSITNLNAATSSYETKGRSIVSSSAQITAFGFISSSAAIPSGTVSGSSQLTSSFDLRYLVTGSVTSSINALNTATSSYETKGRAIHSGSTGDYIFNSISVQNITGSASASFVSLAVNTTTPSQKIHLKGIVGIEAGTTGGNTADQIIFGYNGSGLTQYNHKIQTGHDAQAHLNRMDFLLANSSNTWKTPLQLRPDIVYVSGSLIVTGSINGTINATNGVISGSSQILGASGIVSGSSQITYASISSIPSGIVSGAAQIPALLPSGVVSGSSQVLGGSGVASGSYETTGRSIISSSAQIIPLLPAGVVSGSSQVITSNAITLGTHTTGNYVATITGTANQITVAGSGLETAAITLSTPQDIHTSATPQFSSLGIGTAASGVGGEIRATGDIVAFYSSDERLKSNIQPIGDALDKVNQISGNVYDWKEGFEDIHSHTGTDIGVIAQEIEKVLPQAVIDRESGYKAVNYEKIVPLLIEAIKELSAKVKELENK